MGDFGYTQFDPWTDSAEANSLLATIRSVMAQMETMRLVEIVAVTPGAGTPPVAGTVDVHPLVNQVDGVGNATPHGTVHGVPYVRLAGGDSAVIIEPAVGDIGYVVCDSRDTSNVRETGKEANPGSFRMFDLSDGVYIGRLLATDPPAQYLWFSADGATLVDRNGNKWVGSTNGIDVTPKAGKPQTIHGDEHVTGNMVVDGTLTAVSLGIDGETASIKRIFSGVLNFSGTAAVGLSALTTVTISGIKSGDVLMLSSWDLNAPVSLVPIINNDDLVIFLAVNTSGAPQAVSISSNILVFGTT